MVGPGLVTTALRLAAEVLGVRGLRPASLLDPAPLPRSLDRWIDWEALQRNLRARRLEAVCAVATSLLDGVPVAFVDGTRPPKATGGQGIRYARVRFGGEHVRASAALPLLFPPVEITRPRAAAGYYLDGATRLNTPIKPALALGATRVIVIAFEPLDRPGALTAPRPPRLTDVAANIVDGLLVDGVVDDIHRLAAINAFFAESPATAVSAAARGYRSSRGREHYRRIPYALVAPSAPGELGAIAGDVLRARYRGLGAWLRPDFAILATLLGSGRPSTGDLLSFLLFDEDYVERLIAAGRADAERWLARHPDFWCTDATHDLGIAPDAGGAGREQGAIEEFRLIRRR
jgi:NTE family protein